MQEKILLNIDNPGQLEKLYRSNKPTFKSAFNDLYVQLRENPLAEGWYQRLNYAQEEMFWGTPAERTFVVGAALVAAFIAKLPEIFSIDPEFFYTRNIGFIIFPVLIAFFARKNSISMKTGAGLVALILAGAIFINLLPHKQGLPADTLSLSCIHFPLLLWSMLGFTFAGGKGHSEANWLGFLRYNGELAVMMALLLIAGGLTTALTINLFRLIGLDIQKFYFNYIVICGLSAVPLVATFLTQTQPAIVSKISPLIAKLFAPVALVILLAYLGAMLFSSKNPYQDREFLVLFNVLLVGVMALIFFSIADSGTKNSVQRLVLFLLSAVTIIVNGIALSAVLFRISEWGITPNRAAVLGANVLMLIHLLLVSARLFGALKKKGNLEQVGKSIVLFVPVYAAWAAIVTFLFPFIFGFK
ncbi:DUF4153 domain-containing protein [Dyadobacter luticola]|uniref:DUF4153 domain-containing protein n=1 Tax=Dyadobacter luticola TaxID=1979387 RepID=A0A5R9L483_9BACT|nr:DUF4153 domain-containing protein [Dyadobacter luticola]TLV03394.1 DUF4153 domain-containing protein [Dyadobacter luticola]